MTFLVQTAAHGDPAEWQPRGLTPPDEIAAIVQERLATLPVADPTYADFFLTEPEPGHRNRG